MNIKIVSAYNEIENIKVLFREYVDMLGVNLDFQDFENELNTLPGKYSSPKGRMYIAYCDDKLAGCIALRSFEKDSCEMKRLFVRPEFRNHNIGGFLVDRIISDAKEIGYKFMVLDTLTSLKSAVSLYRKKGFKEINSYYNNPLDNVLYFKLELK